MTTALTLINDAHGLIGVKAVGETLDGDSSADALRFLNSLLDSWRPDSYFAYARVAVVGNIPAGLYGVTIGPGSIYFDCDPRPIRIERGSFYRVDGRDYPIIPIEMSQYMDIQNKAATDLGPLHVYLETSFPDGEVFFWPAPVGDLDYVSLQVLQQVDSFADLVTEYDLPGYQRAISYTLAEEIAPLYERIVPPSVVRIAAQARSSVKRANHRVPELDMRRHGGNFLIASRLVT